MPNYQLKRFPEEERLARKRSGNTLNEGSREGDLRAVGIEGGLYGVLNAAATACTQISASPSCQTSGLSAQRPLRHGAAELSLPCMDADFSLIGIPPFLHHRFQNYPTRLPLETLQSNAIRAINEKSRDKPAGHIDSKKSAATVQRLWYEQNRRGG